MGGSCGKAIRVTVRGSNGEARGGKAESCPHGELGQMYFGVRQKKRVLNCTEREEKGAKENP